MLWVLVSNLETLNIPWQIRMAQDAFFIFGGLFGALAGGIKFLLISRLLSGIGLGISVSWRPVASHGA
jgi:hypothetical protein